MKVNTRLRVLRAGLGLSQMETAARAGISLNRYWRIENGYADATPEEKTTVATVLDSTEADAFPEPEPRDDRSVKAVSA